jgi:hypothetical protein
MIDALVILFSVGMCVLIAYRALRLDSVLPWFGAEQAQEQAEPANEPAATPVGWRARARAGGGR